MSRLAGWVLLSYVALDLANPFVPGAVRFTAEEGVVWVEGVAQSGALRLPDGPQAVERRSPLDQAAPAVACGEAPRRALVRMTGWLVNVRTADPPACDLPPSPTDDH